MTPDVLAGELLDAYLDTEPLSASMLGLPGYDERLPDITAAAEAQAADTFAGIAARADNVDDSALAELERQTLDFVRHVASVIAVTSPLPLVEFTITDLYVAPAPMLLHVLPQLPLSDDARIAAYRTRLQAIPEFLQTAAARHADGVSAGRTPLARLVKAAVAQIDRVLSDPTFGNVARAGADDVVDEVVRPAFASYRDAIAALVDTARDDDHPGLTNIPGGEEIYDALVAQHTSRTRTAAELHTVGIELTAQLAEEYAEIGSRVFGTRDRASIFDRLRTDPSLRYTSSEEMLEQARSTVRRAQDAAPEWFGTIPETPCLVEPIPDATAEGAPPAYYVPGALDGTRQGTYFLNTTSPQERFRHTAESFAFHEAVPGHHFQLTIAQALTELPLARRLLRDTACTEGWGLYSERLADEMGLYSSDITRLGMLSADSLRVGRLVVDSGLHLHGWTRQQAIDWMAANAPMPMIEIEAEVDRYIAMPGQALSYMVGRLELLALRSEATGRLNSRFDLRGFHDLLLQVGPLPLTTLRGAVDRWVAEQAA
ncbi:MAG: hypothetical protein QOG53_536 [Frankiales bacterium]|jgi:uncharacterized protein (DUF885 family)|nr:hypothetical protein [Frankiales bacterium]